MEGEDKFSRPEELRINLLVMGSEAMLIVAGVRGVFDKQALLS